MFIRVDATEPLVLVRGPVVAVPGFDRCLGWLYIRRRWLRYLPMPIRQQNRQRRDDPDKPGKQKSTRGYANRSATSELFSLAANMEWTRAFKCWEDAAKSIPQVCERCSDSAARSAPDTPHRLLFLWRMRDDRQIARELTVEVQFPGRVPRRGMEEDKRSAEHGQRVPHKILTVDVVQFVAQNIFELGAVMAETEIGQEDGWAESSQKLPETLPRRAPVILRAQDAGSVPASERIPRFQSAVR